MSSLVLATAFLAAMPAVLWGGYTLWYWPGLKELLRVGAVAPRDLFFGHGLYAVVLAIGGAGLCLRRSRWALLVLIAALALGVMAHMGRHWPAEPSVALVVSIAGLAMGVAAILACALALRS